MSKSGWLDRYFDKSNWVCANDAAPGEHGRIPSSGAKPGRPNSMEVEFAGIIELASGRLCNIAMEAMDHRNRGFFSFKHV